MQEIQVQSPNKGLTKFAKNVLVVILCIFLFSAGKSQCDKAKRDKKPPPGYCDVVNAVDNGVKLVGGIIKNAVLLIIGYLIFLILSAAYALKLRKKKPSMDEINEEKEKLEEEIDEVEDIVDGDDVDPDDPDGPGGDEPGPEPGPDPGPEPGPDPGPDGPDPGPDPGPEPEPGPGPEPIAETPFVAGSSKGPQAPKMRRHMRNRGAR